MLWIRLQLAPWWVRALYGAGSAWLAAGIAEVLLWANEQAPRDYHRTSVALSPLWLAIIFGLFPFVMAVIFATEYQRQRGQYCEAVAGLPATEKAAAIKAIWRGPVPTDSAVRAAAIRVGNLYLESRRRLNRRYKFCWYYFPVFFGGMGLLNLAEHNHWASVVWIATGAAVVLGLVWARYSARRLQHRIAELVEA